MNLEIFEGDLPFVRTRKALFVLDLQNDLVSTGSLLHVHEPTDFIQKTVKLAPIFRRTGTIFWVLSQFEASRPTNTASPDAERVITDKELPLGTSKNGDASATRPLRRVPKDMLKLYKKMMADNGGDDIEADLEGLDDGTEEEPYTNETFLTLEPGKAPECVVPKTLGANFTQAVEEAIDGSKDIIFTKTDYSAFKSGKLVQKLRGQFVTEIYVCGALSNISVFATVMDAARYGFQITLVEDCLGYRNKARHDEALRQLIDATGCEVMQSSEIIESVKEKESAVQSRPTDVRKRVRGTQDQHNLHQMMAGLKLKNESNGTGRPNSRPTSSHSSKEAQKPLSSTSTETGKSALARESTDSIPSASEDSLEPPLELPKKTENERKRVPNKIKTRRRRSDSTTNDPEKLGSSLKSKEGKDAKKVPPVSPTHITLSGVAEALKKAVMPQSSTDEEAVAEASLIKNPNLGALLEVDSPQSISNKDYPKSAAAKENGNNVTNDAEIVPENSTVRLAGQSTISELKSTNVKEISSETPLGEQTKSGIVSEKVTKSDFEDISALETDSYPICGGDSMIIHNLLAKKEAENIFQRVRNEVGWQKMCHHGGEVPRLVAVQGEINENGGIPVYRHPSDESPPLLPFSPTVSVIKTEVERRLGHKVNHCLIQFYRSGTDFISEHSDKTLDIAPNTFIANVSLGAMRAMTFRSKKPSKSPEVIPSEEIIPRMSCKAPLPHNSMCKMSLLTNEKWLHSIRQDKRAEREKSEAELAYGGGRISLTFRLIGTFLDKDEIKIWGQGAVAKEESEARPVLNGETPDAEKMIRAFGTENHSSSFDWKDTYGNGFDVLHISNTRKLFLSGDAISDLRVKIALAAHGIEWVEGKLSPIFIWKDGKVGSDAPEVPEAFPIRFIDNDPIRSLVQGDLAILLYLDAIHPVSFTTSSSNRYLACKYTRLQQADTLLQRLRDQPFDEQALDRALKIWDIYATENAFIAGPHPSAADYAFWPVLREIIGSKLSKRLESQSENLAIYHNRMLKEEAVLKVDIALPETEDNVEK
jgi:nicotinamidase-related amidase/alkylated DNA repair dioxygenase AlkB